MILAAEAPAHRLTVARIVRMVLRFICMNESSVRSRVLTQESLELTSISHGYRMLRNPDLGDDAEIV